jgi:hypothetical protein
MSSAQNNSRSTSNALLQAKRICARATGTFSSDASLLKAARVLFSLRSTLDDDLSAALLGKTGRAERSLSRVLHERIDRSESPYLVGVFKRHRLTRLEREVLLALVLSATGMVARIGDVEDLQTALGREVRDGLSVVRALAEGAPLVEGELVEVEDDCAAGLSDVSVSAAVLEPLVSPTRRRGSKLDVATNAEFLDRLYGPYRALKAHADELSQQGAGYRYAQNANPSRTRARVRRQMRLIEATLRRHPRWPLSRAMRGELETAEREILVVLIAKELGYQRPDDDVFSGDGLARCVSTTVPEVRHSLRFLARDARLRADSFIVVCGGAGSPSVEDESALRSSEFELSQSFRKAAQIPRYRRSRNVARRPCVRMASLVLPKRVREAVDMIAAQAQHANVLLEEWGLGEVVTYGRGVTVLFSGPPGVGKTACAEAIAGLLDREILVASYAEIQNCYIGQTEKNIVRLFRDAAEAGAVLFWDEADAMFFDRDDSSHSWEVRDVNVLLQEVERFEGLCVLATNRRVTLDPALERRIALKVEFSVPDRNERTRIWRRLLPRKLPLADGVDVGALAAHELTGGEIKNAVLNAARRALTRGPDARVTVADFDEAIRMESHGKWSAKGTIGFKPRA